MSEWWVPMLLAFMLAGVLLGEAARGLPRFWKWLRFKVWHDLQYSRGYRKGYADGQRNERRWQDES